MPYPELPADGHAKDPTIVLSKRDAREAARLLGLLSEALRDPLDAASDSNEPSREELILRARIMIHSRRLRFDYFKRAMFGEPAWDILLCLYISEHIEGRQPIGRLADLVEVPLSTAARWIDYLEREGLVRREHHPTDKRVIYIRLLAKARDLIDAYLSGAPWVALPDRI